MYASILEGLKRYAEDTGQIPSNILPPGTILDQYQKPLTETQPVIEDESFPIFDINDFVNQLAQASAERNKNYQQAAVSINSYDIAHNCIREIVFKILNYPIEHYTDIWLPVLMRAAIGNAIHEFIQDNSRTFTEKEVSVKVPSIRASIRMDALIGRRVLCEIKSCTYTDYEKILKTRRPRDPDFYQTIYNRYLLHHHLQEAQLQTNVRTPPPKLDNYQIDMIQIIYVAHDLISSECKSFSEAVNHASAVKKLLNSRVNNFFFITSINLDLRTIDVTKYETYIVDKLSAINKYLNSNTIPPKDDRFVSDNCHFCLYKKICREV